MGLRVGGEVGFECCATLRYVVLHFCFAAPCISMVVLALLDDVRLTRDRDACRST